MGRREERQARWFVVCCCIGVTTFFLPFPPTAQFAGIGVVLAGYVASRFLR